MAEAGYINRPSNQRFRLDLASFWGIWSPFFRTKFGQFFWLVFRSIWAHFWHIFNEIWTNFGWCFYELLVDFQVILANFQCNSNQFLGQFLAHLKWNLNQFWFGWCFRVISWTSGWFSGDFGSFLANFQCNSNQFLGQFWLIFFQILNRIWTNFLINLVSHFHEFLVNFRVIFGSFSVAFKPIFRSILVHFWVNFGTQFRTSGRFSGEVGSFLANFRWIIIQTNF